MLYLNCHVPGARLLAIYGDEVKIRVKYLVELYSSSDIKFDSINTKEPRGYYFLTDDEIQKDPQQSTQLLEHLLDKYQKVVVFCHLV